MPVFLTGRSMPTLLCCQAVCVVRVTVREAAGLPITSWLRPSDLEMEARLQARAIGTFRQRGQCRGDWNAISAACRLLRSAGRGACQLGFCEGHKAA